MKASAHTGIVIRNYHIIEGELIALVDCSDYDGYKSLPDSIKFQDKVLGKTGWSSDHNYACYKECVLMAEKYP